METMLTEIAAFMKAQGLAESKPERLLNLAAVFRI
jgi:hypothetical protein